MNVRPHAIGVLLACAACGKDRAPAPATVVLTDPTTRTVVAPPPARDLCADYERRRDTLLRAAMAAVGDAGLRYGTGAWTQRALKDATEAAGLHCFAFARGGWWIEPGSDVDLTMDLEVSTHTTVHAEVDGRALDAWSPDGNGIYVGYGGEPTTMTNALVTDYDGDGVPELWLRTDVDGVEGGHFTGSWVLTVHDGKIAEYGPTAQLGTIGVPVDVDGDGRLDLPVSLDVGIVEGTCMGKGNVAPPDLVAHSLPNGQFSTTDAVALAHAKKWCPGLPARIASPKDALCARVCTEPTNVAATRARIAASCVPWDCALEIDGKPQKPRASQACNDMLDTFDQAMPLSLR